MDNDISRDLGHSAYGQAYEQRDFGFASVTEGWLEEHVRLMGSD